MTERNSMTRQELAYEARTRSRDGLDHLSKDTTHILGGLLDDIREGSDEPALVPRQICVSMLSCKSCIPNQFHTPRWCPSTGRLSRHLMEPKR